MNPKPIILDISEWQVPSQIHYDVLSRQIGGVIVRIQYGSNYEDKHYRTHLAAFQKYNVPVAVYAWVRGTSIADMEKEASDFYRRAKSFQPTFWWLDVEEQSMTDMRSGVE
ncbi:MAG: GH25 family lysozyme, partial [Enterococcus aquimarinus]